MFDLEGVHNLLLRSIVVFNVSKLHVSLLTSGSTLCEQTKSGASSMSYQDPCAKQELSLMQYFVLLVQMEKLIGYFNSGCGLGAFHNWGKKILDCGQIVHRYIKDTVRSFFTSDILTCHGRKSTCGDDKINDGCVPVSSRLLCVLAQWHGLRAHTAMWNVINYTFAFPAITSANVSMRKIIWWFIFWSFRWWCLAPQMDTVLFCFF